MSATRLRPGSQGPEPFEAVVARHGADVLRLCRALLGPADADDAWSETFLSALRAYPRLHPGSDVRAWLLTIAHRRSIDQLRRRARSATPVPDLPDLPAAEDATTQMSGRIDGELLAALDRLAPKQRAAVVHHHVGGLPYAQVAELIGSSEAAARRSAADGIARLRELRELRAGTAGDRDDRDDGDDRSDR